MSKKILIVLSGGQDSTTCLYWAQQQSFDEVHAISFDYGQRHATELECAKKIAQDANVTSHKIVKLGPIFGGDSPLVSDTELEQYADHASLPGGLEKTFVPMRNQMFLTLAASHAYSIGCRNIVTGVCEEDFGGYPDCRRSFVEALETACNLGTFTGEDGALGALKIHTPLMDLTKAQSVDFAVRLGAYKALAFSHTAYDGKFPPIGNDHASLLRAKGFEEAGYPDPLVVRAAFILDDFQLPKSSNYDVAARLMHQGGFSGPDHQNLTSFDTLDKLLDAILIEVEAGAGGDQ